jgi:hypothetical protein
MLFSRKDKRPLFPATDQPQRPPSDFVASEDATWLEGNVVSRIDEAAGVGWYTEHGGAADLAALTLCRLRRARAGERGGPEAGDESVREALREANQEALLWIASRAFSYMDENGFPEAVEPWFDDEGPITTS